MRHSPTLSPAIKNVSILSLVLFVARKRGSAQHNHSLWFLFCGLRGWWLEQFHKLCSVRPGPCGVAVLLVFGCVLARSQGAVAMLPRQNLAKSRTSAWH